MVGDNKHWRDPEHEALKPMHSAQGWAVAAFMFDWIPDLADRRVHNQLDST